MAARDFTNCIEENELLNGSGSRTSIKSRGNRDRSESLESENDLIEYLKGTSYHSCADSGVELKEMQDAPFDSSRAGSEEDMLEYEESGINCDGCRRKRQCTGTEKSLIVFGFVCLIVIIALAVAVGKKKEEKEKIVCESKGCLKAASSIIQAMDTTADPCNDFHQYACGGWLKETPIPPGYPVWDRFQELSHKNLYMLQSFIETHTLFGTAQQNVKRFYESCMDESKVSREATLTDFKNLINKVSPDTEHFNLMKTLAEAHKLAIWPLFEVTVGPDERNPEKNIIKIEAGASPFPYGLFKDETITEYNTDNTHESAHTDQATTTSSTSTAPASTSTKSASPAVVDVSNSTNNGSDVTYNVVNETSTAKSTTKAPPVTEQPHIKASHPHPVENVSDLAAEYLKETTVLLVALWKMNLTDAENQARHIYHLEKRLSFAHDINFHVHNRTQAYNGMKITDLQQKCSMIDWNGYLTDLMGSQSIGIKQQNEVIVLHETALRKTCSIVNEYNNNSTLKPILRRYVLLHVARSLKPYFDMNTFQADIDPDMEVEIEGEHWRRCTFYANKAFGYATGSIYVNATASGVPLGQRPQYNVGFLTGRLICVTSNNLLELKSDLYIFMKGDVRIANVRILVEYVKTAFKEYLLRKMWLDAKTKSHAAAKLDEMIEKVSYPSFIMNTTFVDGYYQHFVVETDWFKNLLNWRKFVIKNMVTTLSQKFDRQNSWLSPPVTVESDYSPIKNDIMFPIALFHLPIFSPDGPSAMNFGAIGSLIGHEITHAFDIQGRQYDGYGRLRDWWDPVTADMFNTTTRCMKDQYDHFKIGNMSINGEQTLEENIADNGGLRAAHIAYELWMNENGEDAPLPGVSLTNKQVFYISYAQLYCSKWKESGIKNFLMRDSHSPGPYRIEGALSNSLAFQKIFQCSNAAKYNPPVKCEVW